MTGAIVEERQLDAEGQTPHLSFSRIQKYLICPEQYRLHYIEGLRARVEKANLVFGAVTHLALAEYFRQESDAVATFNKEWQALRDLELRFSRKESWQSLSEKGERLLEKFCREHAQRIGKVISVETLFEFGLSNVNLPFIGFIDLVAEMNGERTVVEFKTAATDYEEHEIALLDQLTAYKLAEPDAERIALCAFVKTKKPRIEWHVTHRTPERVVEFIEKVEIVSEQIERRDFYKRPGKWCRQCEFLPVCLGDRKKVKETLIQIG